MDNIKSWIEAGLPESQVVFVEGDGQHFEAVVLCSTFEGRNRVARHRMVYNALGNRMKSDIHALSLKTHTPDEYKTIPGAKILAY
ncbi:BolA family protein [Coxiella-like endosymbiont]|uniref:BolA family protein n=1 Tax=Coxiella-like endosymbiont TaxID=1592897 RepID=UPI0027294FA5|nr:BolA/IbaG family iron-sulfur metabolism protein [Coxiella-like endosymbiont]